MFSVETKFARPKVILLSVLGTGKTDQLINLDAMHDDGDDGLVAGLTGRHPVEEQDSVEGVDQATDPLGVEFI